MRPTFKKEKIFFVYPPSPIMNREDRCQQLVDIATLSSANVPLDMLTLGAIAKNCGYETKFKDYSLNQENTHDFIRDLREYKPDFLVINVASTNLENDLSILKEANDLLSETIVIAKGAVFNFQSYSIAQKHPEIDIILKGEEEEAFEEIIKYKPLNEIKGILYQVKNKVTATPRREPKPNLDFLPIPDRDLIDNKIYLDPITRKPQTIIRVSKGCPNGCFFCLATPLNGNIRYRSPELIIKEIKQCIAKYNIRNFVFWADVFNYDKEYVRNLCNLIIREKLKIKYCTSTRADTVDLQTLKLMKKSGCYLLTMGVESGSQEILDKIGKNLTLSQIEEAVKTIEGVGIKLHTYYVLGLPWETTETLNMTYKFASKLNTCYASFFTAAALCGTKFFEYINRKRLANKIYEKPYVYPNAETFELNEKIIYDCYRKFNKNYYKRPIYTLKMAKYINYKMLATKTIRRIRNFPKLLKRFPLLRRLQQHH